MTGREKRLATFLEEVEKTGWIPGQVAGWSAAETAKNYSVLANCGVRKKSFLLTAASVELLAAEHPDTVRGNMYLAVSAGILPDTGKKSYGRIQRLLGRLRDSGVVPMSWIVDTIRTTIKPSSWSGLADFAETVREAYRKDYWASLPEYVCIVAEKDAIAARIQTVTQEYDLPLHPIRGYSSKSYAWGIAQEIAPVQKPVIVYYVGDHDPSGRDLERNIKEQIEHYSKRDLEWTRIALNEEHFEQFDLLELKPKKNAKGKYTDKRAPAFVAKYGERCAEVDAIPASELREMVEAAIRSHINPKQWRKLEKIEQAEEAQWQDFLEQFLA